MNETNDIKHVSEIQIDCDYTSKSRKIYYDFLKEVSGKWAKSGKGNAILSTTIRLHQLAMKVPPVDYGALMIYNTGDPRKWEERNPILDYRDVYPYLKKLNQYNLPLAAAYPVFQWVRDIQGVRVEHTVEAEEILQVKKAMEDTRDNLKKAIKKAGIEPVCEPFRGGTDGAALSFRGLPCPNLSAGYENAHGRFEYVPIQSMVKNVEILINCIAYALEE
jgi:hypothetical protein